MSKAQEHLEAIKGHAKNGLDAHINADDDTVRRSFRKIIARCERALEESDVDSIDPIANPTGAMGAQVSNGREPRSYDPEVRRLQDQRRSCQIAYDEKLRQMGRRW